MKLLSFQSVYVKSVKADFVKGEIAVTLSLPLDPDTLAVRDELAAFVKDEHSVKVVIESAQMKLNLDALIGKPAE